jgi:membrane-associated protease RseP (regulator of RpoE activity)
MLITSLNLLPVGQLDGGHIARALSGEKTAYISAAVPLILMTGGIYYSFKRRNAPILGVLRAVVRSRGTSAADQRYEKARR